MRSRPAPAKDVVTHELVEAGRLAWRLYSILFDSILFYSILFYAILSYYIIVSYVTLY